MAGNNHAGSERAEAGLGTFVSWTHWKYFLPAFQFNTRKAKEREFTDLVGNHVLLLP